MTNNDQNLRDSFRSFDQPVHPPSALASSLGLETPVHRRSTWAIWTAAAAAILILLGAAAMLLDTQTPDSRTQDVIAGQVIAAPGGTPVASPSATDDSSAVMFGGTAAQSISYPGRAPDPANLQKLWESADNVIGDPMFYGDALYVLGYPEGDQDFDTSLTAYDAATGTLRWQTNVASGQFMAIDQNGIYVAITAETNMHSFARLDAATGQIVWQTNETVSTLDLRSDVLLVSNNTLVVAHGETSLLAFDTTTGTKAWEWHAAGSGAIDCTYLPCGTTPAIRDGQVYLLDWSSNQLLALDLVTGIDRWKTPILSDTDYANAVTASTTLTAAQSDSGGISPDQVPFFRYYQLSATAYGPVLIEFNWQDPQNYPTVIHLYTAKDGALAWNRTMANSTWTQFAISETTLYAATQSTAEGAKPTLALIDLASGTDLSSHEIDLDRVHWSQMIYLPHANMLITGTNAATGSSSTLSRIPIIGSWFGSNDSEATIWLIDPTTLDARGKATFKNCYVASTFSQSGQIVCQSTSGKGFAVYGTP